MFASRFFNARHFAARYFAATGAATTLGGVYIPDWPRKKVMTNNERAAILTALLMVIDE